MKSPQISNSVNVVGRDVEGGAGHLGEISRPNSSYSATPFP